MCFACVCEESRKGRRKGLLMKEKEESEKVGLKLNIQKINHIMINDQIINNQINNKSYHNKYDNKSYYQLPSLHGK